MTKEPNQRDITSEIGIINAKITDLVMDVNDLWDEMSEVCDDVIEDKSTANDALARVNVLAEATAFRFETEKEVQNDIRRSIEELASYTYRLGDQVKELQGRFNTLADNALSKRI